MVEEQHVTHYGSLLNPRMTWLENLLVHQYTECYLYYSCHALETNKEIREVWGFMFELELGHLHMAAEMLRRYEGKEWQQVIPEAEFPAPLRLESNIAYVRGVLQNTVHNTACREQYVNVCTLGKDSDFFQYQKTVNSNLSQVMSHRVIEDYIQEKGRDYRFETAQNPVPELRDRVKDNTASGRTCQVDLVHG